MVGIYDTSKRKLFRTHPIPEVEKEVPFVPRIDKITPTREQVLGVIGNRNRGLIGELNGSIKPKPWTRIS